MTEFTLHRALVGEQIKRHYSLEALQEALQEGTWPATVPRSGRTSPSVRPPPLAVAAAAAPTGGGQRSEREQTVLLAWGPAEPAGTAATSEPRQETSRRWRPPSSVPARSPVPAEAVAGAVAAGLAADTGHFRDRLVDILEQRMRRRGVAG